MERSDEERWLEKQLDSQGRRADQSRQLLRENQALRRQVSQLESRHHHSEQLTREWQNFGQYTAKVLKNETDTYEVKVQLLHEQVEKLSRENKELKEMCLYLDRSGSSADNDSKLTSPEAATLHLHSNIMSKLGKREASLPQFSGTTSRTTLKDRSKKQVKEAWSGMQIREALDEMKKRIERLEKEKLELVKSLSAAHLLTASCTSSSQDPSSEPAASFSDSERQAPPPPDHGDTLSRPTTSGVEPDVKGREKDDSFTTPEIAINAATLLDVCRRLDAAELSSHSDPIEEAESATLRVLLNIAWQKVQEQHLRKNSNVYTPATNDHT